VWGLQIRAAVLHIVYHILVAVSAYRLLKELFRLAAPGAVSAVAMQNVRV
jgi:hypothetical protein